MFDFKNMDKKMKLYIIISGSVIAFIILLLIILKIAVGGRVDSKNFELRIKKAAITYYEKYPNKLPKNSGEKVTISDEKLVESGTLKNLDKLLDKGLTCSGSVNVSNNNGVYLYQPIVKCSDKYETKLLYKQILEDNMLQVDKDGLYKVYDYYLFRGEKLNNYVSFAGHNWRILKINSDNTVRIILEDNLDTTVWDDRYNAEKDDTVGKNNYSISRIKEYFDDIINGKSSMFNDESKALIVPSTLCIGARDENATNLDGSIECATKLEKQSIGLLQVNEYANVSLDNGCKSIFDSQCMNYNFLADFNNFWTITADSKNSYSVYKIAGTVIDSNASSYAQPRMVINISADAIYTKGNGTKSNPYIIK